MTISPAEIVGGLAAALSMFTFSPQAVRVIRTRDTAAISLATYVIVVVSTVLWGAYGVLTASAPIIIANVVNGGFSVVILALKARDVWRSRRP
jgi:MtN3 and saliva related transmembrane protein